jgi:hypothetical protein
LLSQWFPPVADGGKYAKTCENVRLLLASRFDAGGVISQEFVVRLFGFFVIMKRTPSIGAIDCAGRWRSLRVLGLAWRKVEEGACCTQREKPRYNERTRSILISSLPFTFDSLFARFARGRRYRDARERSALDRHDDRPKDSRPTHCVHFFVAALSYLAIDAIGRLHSSRKSQSFKERATCWTILPIVRQTRFRRVSSLPGVSEASLVHESSEIDLNEAQMDLDA